MFTRRKPFRTVCLGAVVGGLCAAQARAQDTLILYGPSGPSPAISDAATAFGRLYNVKLEVRSGPIDSWMERAMQDADLIYSSAEYMMSSFVRNEALKIDAASVTPLYIRPSVLLVRPGNPKEVRDFPDLLHPGMRVMVVTGSGQTGLWEDMAGKLGDVRTLRELRRNIVYFAPTSDSAFKAWKEREDIDVWITWNIWLMPLRDSAKLVPVSRDYRVYRQCSIAMTERGKRKPAARQFVNFLNSPEGARVFDSWGWIVPTDEIRPLAINRDICVVCGVDTDESENGIARSLLRLRALMADYERLGVPSAEVHLHAVFHDDTVTSLLADSAYAGVRPEESYNPNQDLVRELVQLGVSLEVCAKTMEEHDWTNGDLLPGVRQVPCAFPRIIDLEQQGCAYVRF